MHELSIASSIVELVEQEAKKANAKKVTKVILDIGSMAGIENEALLFAWDIVTQDTIIQKAPLEINMLAATAKCNDCGHSFEIENFFTPCPSCSGFHHEVIQGKEMRINSILIDD